MYGSTSHFESFDVRLTREQRILATALQTSTHSRSNFDNDKMLYSIFLLHHTRRPWDITLLAKQDFIKSTARKPFAAIRPITFFPVRGA